MCVFSSRIKKPTYCLSLYIENLILKTFSFYRGEHVIPSISDAFPLEKEVNSFFFIFWHFFLVFICETCLVADRVNSTEKMLTKSIFEIVLGWLILPFTIQNSHTHSSTLSNFFLKNKCFSDVGRRQTGLLWDGHEKRSGRIHHGWQLHHDWKI